MDQEDLVARHDRHIAYVHDHPNLPGVAAMVDTGRLRALVGATVALPGGHHIGPPRGELRACSPREQVATYAGASPVSSKIQRPWSRSLPRMIVRPSRRNTSTPQKLLPFGSR